MADIKGNIETIFRNIEKYSPSANLVVVTKYVEPDKILEAYNAGHRDFGESYIQQLCQRAENLPQDIRWHMIGHIQTNKIKYLAKIPNLYMIHSIDSIKVVKEIEKRFEKKIKCLIEINTSGEKSKSGMSPDFLEEFIEEYYNFSPSKVELSGLMTISGVDFSDKEKEKCFVCLRDLQKKINTKFKKSRLNLIELSIGMSDDYLIALKNGSTLIRVGSAIFS